MSVFCIIGDQNAKIKCGVFLSVFAFPEVNHTADPIDESN